MTLAEDYQQKRAAVQDLILEWAAAHLRDYPWRNVSRSAYEILVAEVLLKRTTATAAGRVYRDFINQFPSPQHLAHAPISTIARALSNVGLQQQRARSFKALAHYLIANEAGQVPTTLPRLLKIPGLGAYGARAVLSFGHGIPAAILDANVERILHRLFLDSLPERPSQDLLQELADQLLPTTDHRDYNFALLDLGGVVCRYVDPRCHECPLNTVCDYRQQYTAGKISEPPGRYETPTSANLRRIRSEKGLSLQSLAATAGVSKLTVIRIESGKSTPNSRTTARLANALQVAVADLTE